MLTLTKGELVDELSDLMADTHDMDVGWTDHARAIVARLEKLGVAFAREADAPCPSCGRPASVQYGGSCPMGGCPFGADL